jgi:serine/threonine protein kinase
MPYLFRILLIVLGSSSFLNAGLQYDCDQIKSIYTSLKYGAETNAYISGKDIANRYSLVKQFTSGKGGASVYWVKDLEVDRVLKIFPAESFINDFEKNPEIREIFLSCHLAKERFEDSSMTFSTRDKNLFPGFYGYGFTDTDTPFGPQPAVKSGKKHLIMVMEFIKGQDLYVHSEDKKNTLSPLNNKTTTQAIIYQLLTALQRAHKNLGFYHRDLHPGNIIVSSDKSVSITKSTGGTVMAPMIKIIDFGLSTSRYFYTYDQLDGTKAQKMSLPSSRDYSLVLLKFITNMRSLAASPAIIAKAKSVAKDYQAGDDMQFINMLIYTFRNTFDSYNDYCSDYTKCLNDFSKFK